MKHRFLLHSLSHTILVVDVSQIGIELQIDGRGPDTQAVPTFRFRSWKDAAQFLRAKEADDDTIAKAGLSLRRNCVALITVV
jgi:hypothetical protein